MKTYVRLSCTIKIIPADKERKTITIYEANDITVNSSYATLTDTAKVKLSRFTNWRYINEQGQNTIHILGSEGESQKKITKGDKIEIYLGYDFDDKLSFTGFITAIVPDNPFTLECEDPMWALKKHRITKTWPDDNNNLRDVVNEMLIGTDVEIHPESTPEEIELGQVQLSNVTIVEALALLKKKGILVFFKDGKLVLGRSYFASSSNVTNTSISSDNYLPPVYNKELNVITENLAIRSFDKNNLAVEGISIRDDNTSLKVTMILHPEKITAEFMIAEVVDEALEDYSFEEARSAYELTEEARGLKIDLDNYSVTTYHTYNKEIDDLIEDIKGVFFQNFNTGLSGKFTTFGHEDLKTGQTIIYREQKSPEKNGEYLVKDLTKSWGIHGFRQIMNLPHKIR